MSSSTTYLDRLPDILDSGSLAAVSTFESRELAFVRRGGRRRHQYLRALYLKGFQALGHGHYQPGQLPRQMRSSIASQLGAEGALVDVVRIDKRERSRVLTEVRDWLGVRPASKALREQVGRFIADGVARREDELSVLLCAAAERFIARRIEVPHLEQLMALAEGALEQANAAIERKLAASFSAEVAESLIVVGDDDSRSRLDDLKEPAGKASVGRLESELLRFESLVGLQPKKLDEGVVHQSKIAALASQARRYDASQLRQMRPLRRRAILASFCLERHSEQLDRVADMLVRLWQSTRADANEHAESQHNAMSDADEAHRAVLRQLVQVIVASQKPTELWCGIHDYKSVEDYAAMQEELGKIPSRAELYLGKLLDHYGAMRRFLPSWYRLVPLVSTTSDTDIIRAMAVLRDHARAETNELPPRDTPVSFLSSQWGRRAVRRYRRTGQVTRIHKAPYELGWLEATAEGLSSGSVALEGARRFAPMTDHLLAREAFVQKYDSHVKKLGLPAKASDYYEPRREKLSTRLEEFDGSYAKNKRQFWVNEEGKLGFSRLPGNKPSPKTERLSRTLASYMPAVSILDVLLDCHRWTDFASVFRAVGGRQNMPEREKLRHVLAALYAYGCDCGPSQAACALDLHKNQIIHARHHYMPTKHLIEAAAKLAAAFEHTDVAKRLGEPGILLTDAMHLRTLRQSLTARQYHRDLSHPSVLLYQHVTPDCVCQFTQALLVNVSQGLHMLHGVLQCREGNEKVINICDSGGKSNIVFGLGTLLNILLYPRPRSRNMKLWAPSSKRDYKNIGHAFAGDIRWDRIDKGWLDIVWVLASIAAGSAPPVVIFERLAAQPKHPATVGFEELGKLERSDYLLRYGHDLALRRFVQSYTVRREHYNGFTRQVRAFGDLVREKSREGQEELLWFLAVVQNAIVLWNAVALDEAVAKARADGHDISDEALKHVLPTMLEHINFVGRFLVDLRRRPPFRFVVG